MAGGLFEELGRTDQVTLKMFLREMRKEALFPSDQETREEGRTGEATMLVCGTDASECLEMLARLRRVALSRRSWLMSYDMNAGDVGEVKAVGVGVGQKRHLRMSSE